MTIVADNMREVTFGEEHPKLSEAFRFAAGLGTIFGSAFAFAGTQAAMNSAHTGAFASNATAGVITLAIITGGFALVQKLKPAP